MGFSPGRHTACYRTQMNSACSPPWFTPFWILSTFPQFHHVSHRALSLSWEHVHSDLWQSFVTTFTVRLFFAMLRKKKKKPMRKEPHWFPADRNNMVVTNRNFSVIIWSFLMFFKIAMHTISLFIRPCILNSLDCIEKCVHYLNIAIFKNKVPVDSQSVYNLLFLITEMLCKFKILLKRGMLWKPLKTFHSK